MQREECKSANEGRGRGCSKNIDLPEVSEKKFSKEGAGDSDSSIEAE
jgi:hypothetical protein|tara:strand:- start:462 stop:602 length:141 start_codon:yes stop_codon:yes gene_type:complete